jgi:hypothetical protein
VAQVWLELDARWPLGALRTLARGGRLVAPWSAAAQEALGEAATWVHGAGAAGLAACLAEVARQPVHGGGRARLAELTPARTAEGLRALYDEVVDRPAEGPLRAHGHLRELLAAG